MKHLQNYIGYVVNGKLHIVSDYDVIPDEIEFKKYIKAPDNAIALLVLKCDYRRYVVGRIL